MIDKNILEDLKGGVLRRVIKKELVKQLFRIPKNISIKKNISIQKKIALNLKDILVHIQLHNIKEYIENQK